MISGEQINLRLPMKKDTLFLYHLFLNDDTKANINPIYYYQPSRMVNEIIEPQENQINFIVELKNGSPIGLFLNSIEWLRQNVIITIMFSENNIYSARIGFESISILLEFLHNELNARRVEFNILQTNKKMQKLFQFLQYDQDELEKEGLQGKIFKPSVPEIKRFEYVYVCGKYIDFLGYSFIIDQWQFNLNDFLSFARGHFARFYEK